MVAPAPFIDPVPGNIGLLPGQFAVLQLRLDQAAGVLISDELGNLDNLGADAGFTTQPAPVDSWTGVGRSFAGSNGVSASDLANKDTLLLRDVTIQMIIALELGAGAQPTSTIIARGDNDGTVSGAWGYGLELFAPGGGNANVGVRWFWQDSGLTVRTDGGATFQTPGDGAFFLLTATRRWESATSVVMTYYVNDQQIGQTTSANGDIAGGTTGITTVGGRKNRVAGSPVSDYWEHLATCTLDNLIVSAFEMSPEEVTQIYRRLAIYQPAGVAMFAGLAPKGSKWYADPGNFIGRFVKVAGQALGMGMAAAEELRALWLPDAVPLDTVGRWEALCGLAPGPHDSLKVRRARIIGYFSRILGYSVPAVEQAEAAVLDCLPSDLQILEFDNQITDNFATLAAERWWVGTGVPAWAVAGGQLQVTAAMGTNLEWSPADMPAILTPLFLDDTAGSTLNTNYFLACEVASYAQPHNSIAGLCLVDPTRKTWVIFGVYVDAGGTAHMGYATWANYTFGGFTALAAAPAAPLWLRLQQTGGNFVFSWSTVGATPTSSFTSHSIGETFTNAVWGGFAAMCTDGASSAALAVDFASFFMSCPGGNRPFYWYVYRNPALGGSPDIVGGQALAQKIKPAHTYSALTQNTSLLCDDPRDGLCDRGPCGAL